MVLTGGELRHQQVARAIADEIARGALRPGDRLPSERQLCDRFAVSRATVRRALADLVADGLVEGQPGRGSFVAQDPLERSAAQRVPPLERSEAQRVLPLGEPANALTSFTELGAQRGLLPTAEVLAADVAPATIDEAEAFGVAPGADVFVLERLRLLDGHAVSLDHSRIPLHRAPGLVGLDFTSASLYAALDEAGAGPRRAEYALQAVAADPRAARLLGVAPGFPLLQTSTRSFDAAEAVVELGEMRYRGDRYRFRTTLTR